MKLEFNKIHPDFMLVIVAIIWGSGFIAVEYAMDANLSPFMILAGRFTVAALTLLFILRREVRSIEGKTWKKGAIAGVLLFLGFYFQTIGQSMTTVSNSAFLTATNVVFVPFLAWGLTRKRPEIKVFFLAILTFFGVAVLTVNPEGVIAIKIGDIYVLIGAIMFAGHIAYTSIAVKGNNPIVITMIQMLIASILSFGGLAITGIEQSVQYNWTLGITAVLYLGFFATCLCFFMQVSAQKRTTPGKTGIILSMESLFGTIFSIMLNIEPLTIKIVLGGAIILSAVILTEGNFWRKTNTVKNEN